MANEPTIIGTTVIIGFPTGESISGVVRSTYNKDGVGKIEYIPDEDNNDATAIVSALGNRITVEGTMSAANTVRVGDTVTVNSIKYIVEAVGERRTTLAARITMTLYKPDAMTIA